ncbi:hypothetical protein BDV34DRAFT_233376 [Aspergillus parasiticus]|uniref:Uncharacterized protein n=1 Tax=Aspergillus parasiticus TaxID=5067 RepID=A0A5N6D1G8_ASPPA|nr:hypothetical protein BDV34DRAFT_233376 [Aspergillus parasiticus]
MDLRIVLLIFLFLTVQSHCQATRKCSEMLGACFPKCDIKPGLIGFTCLMHCYENQRELRECRLGLERQGQGCIIGLRACEARCLKEETRCQNCCRQFSDRSYPIRLWSAACQRHFRQCNLRHENIIPPFPEKLTAIPPT